MNLKRFFVYALLLLVVCNQFVLSQETIRHEVQQGENISSIARKYGVTKEAIMSLNNKDNPNKILIGETLIIPPRDGFLNDVNNSQSGNSLNAPTDNSPSRGKGCGNSHTMKRIIDIRIFVVSIIVFVVTFWVRKRYWNKIKITNKETVYKVVIALGILLALLSITGIRKLLLWLMGISVVGVSFYYLIRKIIDNKQGGHKIADNKELVLLRNKVIEQEQVIAGLNATIRKYDQKIKTFEKIKNDLTEKNTEFKKRLDEIKYISKEKDSLSKTFQNDSCYANCADGNGGDKLYAEAILDGVLLKVKDKINEDSIFELDLQSKDTAILNILSSAHKRILANSAFIHGCDKQVIGNTNISVTPGKAILSENGRWVVTVKPVVIIR